MGKKSSCLEKKIFIWDFHGVLETGTENAVLEISNKALEASNRAERLTIEQCNQLYGKEWWEYFARIMPYEPHTFHILLQNLCYALDSFDIIKKYIKPAPYAYEVLEKIKENHEQILISKVNPPSLYKFIDSVSMRYFFGEGKAFASNDKKKTLAEFLENKKFDSLVIIGDSPSDIELKNVAGGVTYLYSHPWRQFRECDAQYKIHDLREVLREV